MGSPDEVGDLRVAQDVKRPAVERVSVGPVSGHSGSVRHDPGECKKRVRIAAMSDVHVGKTGQGTLQPLLAAASESADMLVICGDLTDYGLADEARVLARELTAAVRVPIVAVLGNHDYEGGEEDQIRTILVDAGVTLLDGDACEVRGVGFAGVKGFAGGFGRGTLAAWGETTIKQFVHEAVNEALKLESALARLRTTHRIALLHYAPVRDTVVGEPPEIYPFLGSSRLEEPLGRYLVTAVVHGHAHNGTEEGRTATGIPVYNVAMPLLRKLRPDSPPFRILEVDETVGSTAAPSTA
ncbi:MAG: metallophosphoesterase [Gemmatimonadaceae bacterium]